MAFTSGSGTAALGEAGPGVRVEAGRPRWPLPVKSLHDLQTLCSPQGFLRIQRDKHHLIRRVTVPGKLWHVTLYKLFLVTRLGAPILPGRA